MLLLLGILAGAEDGGADSDEGATFGDGEFEVVGHAHGKGGGVGGEEGGGDAGVAELAEEGEAGADGIGVVGVEADGHEAADAEGLEGAELLKEGFELIGRDAVFAGFAGGVDLDEDVDDAGLLLEAAIEGDGEVEAIEGLDGGGVGEGVFGFVSLEVSDEVGFVGDVGEGGGFVAEFLDFVFADESGAGVEGGDDVFGWDGFGGEEEADGGFGTIGGGAGVADAGADGGEVGED